MAKTNKTTGKGKKQTNGEAAAAATDVPSVGKTLELLPTPARRGMTVSPPAAAEFPFKPGAIIEFHTKFGNIDPRTGELLAGNDGENTETFTAVYKGIEPVSGKHMLRVGADLFYASWPQWVDNWCPLAIDVDMPAAISGAATQPPVAASQTIPLADIISEDNSRSQMDPAGLQTLADSIRTAGVVQPVIVVATGDGKYRLIAGFRRVAAAKLAGLSEIPAQVYAALADIQAEQIHLIENIQRENLSHMDLARRYGRARDIGKLSGQAIARLAHTSADHVQKHLLLLRLCPAVVALIDNGRLPVKYGERVARVGTEQEQIDLAAGAVRMAWDAKTETWKQKNEYGGDERIADQYLQPLGNFMREIDRSMRGLASAGWRLDVEFAGRRPCLLCPYHSDTITREDGSALVGTAPQAAATKGYCLDGACYAVKEAAQAAVVAKRKAQAEKETAVKVQKAQAAGLVVCEGCVAMEGIETYNGKPLCPKCKGKAEKQAGKGARDGDAYARQKRELKKLQDAFPTTPDEQYALALWKYGSKLESNIGRHLAGLSASECEKQLPVLVYLALGHGFFGTSAKLMPKGLQPVAAGKFKWTAAHFAALWKTGGGFGDNSQAAPKVDWQGRTVNVPLPAEVLAEIAALEALAKLWKIQPPTKPDVADFADKATAAEKK